MREKKVIHHFVCDAMLKMAKPKMGIKSSDSDHAYLLDFRVCHQNKTKLLLGIFMFCWFLFVFCSVLWCDILYFVTQQNIHKPETTTKA